MPRMRASRGRADHFLASRGAAAARCPASFYVSITSCSFFPPSPSLSFYPRNEREGDSLPPNPAGEGRGMYLGILM